MKNKMNIEELENKLKISENTCIHCSTLELAKKVLSIFHKLGLTWCSKKHYTLNHNWDRHKENTVYYPFDGEFSSLEFAQLAGYKIISAEEFISLHTERKEFDLENYVPKGQLEGFPKEVIARMLQCQEEQGNKKDISVFEEDKFSFLAVGGFDWDKTKEKEDFWNEVITGKIFNLFFKKYPKQYSQDYSQEFKVGDKVYDIIYGEIGVIKRINIDDTYSIHVSFNDNTYDEYLINGVCRQNHKIPQLLHYRDDYDYSVIDFNNLPKRQEPKRWRTEEGGCYYFIKRGEYDFNLDKIYRSLDYYNSFSNELYKIGNYFQTREEAEIITQKLNIYFEKLIQEEHERI